MTDKNSIKREDLLKAAQLVRPALASQSFIPALTHIKFDGKRATAYNDVASISVKALVEVQRCVPGELLIKALTSFGGSELLIQEGKDGSILLSSGRSKLKLPTLANSAFPFNQDLDGTEIPLDAEVVKGIERCLLSVGNDPTHPAQMGVTLESDSKGKAVLYSTDNFTISRYQTKANIELPGNVPIILPTFFCEQMAILAKTFKDEPMVLVAMPGGLLVEFGESARLFTKTLVDLEPLDFPRIIERHCKLGGLKSQLREIPTAFDGALNRALLVLSNEVDKSTKFTVTQKALTMVTTSTMGDSDDSMEHKPDPELFPDDDFFVDPALLARASKACVQIAFMDKVIVMADTDSKFIHLVAHCSR
jgi:DNA polymerase III sliding clamp (beta) subunit (PCNA family)